MNPLKLIATIVVSALLCLSATAQTPAAKTPDQEIRAAYQKLEAAREAMSGEITDEERTQRMATFQEAGRKLLADWEGRSAELKTGLFDLGRTAIQCFSPEKAIPYLQTFLLKNKGSKDSAEATMFLGDAYRAVNKTAEAIALYEEFLKKNPKHELVPSARLGLATSFFLALEFDQAVRHYRMIIEKHPQHDARGDAAFQLLNALNYAGRYDEARTHLAQLQKEAPEAPELAQKKIQFELLGRSAPELSGVINWQGIPGTSVARMRGRVLVLCFFMVKNIPCARTLQSLSRLEKDLRLNGVSVWGLSKTYRAGKGDWKLEDESRWLAAYRKNPRYVLERELRYTPKGGAEEDRVWAPLEKPIGVSLALTRDTSNLKAYKIRRVPTVVVIDKDGRIRLIEEGGQPEGGFQSQMLRRLVKKIAAE